MLYAGIMENMNVFAERLPDSHVQPLQCVRVKEQSEDRGVKVNAEAKTAVGQSQTPDLLTGSSPDARCDPFHSHRWCTTPADTQTHNISWKSGDLCRRSKTLRWLKRLASARRGSSGVVLWSYSYCCCWKRRHYQNSRITWVWALSSQQVCDKRAGEQTR